MSRPEALRRRALHQADTGRRLLLSAGLTIAVIATGLAVWREASDPRFFPEIGAVRGLVHESEADVITAAALEPGQNAWFINRKAVAARVEALPWVGQASVIVRWPNRVTIDVSEREAVARIELSQIREGQAPPRYALVDATKRILALTYGPDYSQLPLLAVLPRPSEEAIPGKQLASKEVARALRALGELRAFGLSPTEVDINSSTGIGATADRNIRVLFGEDEDLVKKVQLFQTIAAKISTPQRIAYVDVRSIRAPTVLYR